MLVVGRDPDGVAVQVGDVVLKVQEAMEAAGEKLVPPSRGESAVRDVTSMRL